MHPNAFGLSIPENKIEEFLQKTDEALKFLSDSTIYRADYIFDNHYIDKQAILDIADLGDLWGKNMEEPYIIMDQILVRQTMVSLKSPDKNPTLVITLPCGVELIKFGSSEEEYNSLLSHKGGYTINFACQCQKNEWNGKITPQLKICEYEIIGEKGYVF